MLLMVFGIQAQTVSLKGKITANGDVGGIHILNPSSGTFSVSINDGHFSISAKLNDTLVFSGISFQLKKVTVDREMVHSGTIAVSLVEKINVLDEVVVGKVLTGHLSADIANSEVKRSISFYELGIPGYTGKPKTQNERRLYEAGDFKPIQLLGLLGGSLPLNPILNAISGRIKALKKRVHLENRETCISRIKSQFSEILFASYPMETSHQTAFFYFCADSAEFDAHCYANDDFALLDFLQKKLVSYKLILEIPVQE